MKIVELVGLPGCGKSTIINLVISESDRHYVIRRELFRTKIPLTWVKQYAVIIRLLISMRSFYFHSSMGEKKKYYYRLIKLILCLTYYSEKNPSSIMLLDEGLVQYFTSLAYDTNLDKGLSAIIIKQLKTFNPIIIDCKIPIELAGKRIMFRNSNSDRYKNEDVRHQTELLQQKRGNLDYVLSLYQGTQYTLDMEKPKEELAKELLDILEKCYGKS